MAHDTPPQRSKGRWVGGGRKRKKPELPVLVRSGQIICVLGLEIQQFRCLRFESELKPSICQGMELQNELCNVEVCTKPIA